MNIYSGFPLVVIVSTYVIAGRVVDGAKGWGRFIVGAMEKFH